ncbi:pseudouridine synthase, partial [Chlamydiota bacterium]
MISWKVKNTNRLLTEVKNKFSGRYTVKDIRWSIDHNRCFVNKSLERFGSTLVQPGDTVSIKIEKRYVFSKEPGRILFEDEHLLVYDKPHSVTTEQLGNLTGCLLVHRLDRDTTGVIALAKTAAAQKNLEEQFRARTVVKEYLALVAGNPGEEGVISGKMAPLSRREGAVIWGMARTGLFSQTRWQRLSMQGKLTLLSCTPLTGRTHQIRVHLAHIGHPIAGDATYGTRHMHTETLRPLLHAHTLQFTHPTTGAPLRLT